jgi:signal transduction histidine kinase
MSTTATSHRSADAVARERERIANQMHDEVAPLLFAAQLRLDSAEERGTDLASAVAGARDLISASEARIHEIVAVLAAAVAGHAPLDVRIADLVSALEEQFALSIGLVIDPSAVPAAATLADVHADLMTTAVREGVVNAVRHGHAERVTVRLRWAGRDHLAVSVEDDGGIGRSRVAPRPGRSGGHGLRTLRRHAAEQGGHVDLTVWPGSGATLTVTVPVGARLA